MSQVLSVSDGDFDEKVINAEMPVLVDFWAEWCGPCRAIASSLVELAEQYSGRVTIVKLNIDDNPSAPQRYGVRSIPTLMLFKDGEVEGTKIGALPKGQLAQFIEDNL